MQGVRPRARAIDAHSLRHPHLRSRPRHTHTHARDLLPLLLTQSPGPDPRAQNMPLEHLWSEEAVRDGDTRVIVPLLLQARRAYGHHLRQR